MITKRTNLMACIIQFFFFFLSSKGYRSLFMAINEREICQQYNKKNNHQTVE